MIARAFARAGRVANAPVFLLTDEKVLQTVVGLGVSRRSSCSSGCCWGRIVEHISGLNYCCGLPAWSESLVWPAAVRGETRWEARAVRTERFGLLLCEGEGPHASEWR